MTMQQITRLYTHLCAAWQALWPREEGAHLVLIALIMPVLLSFAGFALDGSNAYHQNQRVQIAADAAALGGVRLLALGKSTADASAEAQRLVTLNVNGATSVVSFLNGNTQIQVTTTHSFPTYFAGIMGFYTMTVSASAKAHFASVASTGNLMPFTVKCEDMANLTLGAEAILHEPSANAPGNMGWTRWDEDNPSAVDLAYNINNPQESDVVQIGGLVNATTGNTNADSVETALKKWYGKQVIIPLYDQVTQTGSGAKYRVCGFAVFVLTNWDKAAKTLTGTFVRSVIDGNGIATGVTDYGARDIRITQ